MLLNNMWLILKFCFIYPFKPSVIHNGVIWSCKDFYDRYVVINDKVISLEHTPITIYKDHIQLTGMLNATK